MSPAKRRSASEAIREAAFQGAASSGSAPFGSPPLSSGPAGAASSRRQASRTRASRSARRQPALKRSTHPVRPANRDGNGANGSQAAEPARRSSAFQELVGEDEDWRDNPSAAMRFGERILDRIASGTFEGRDPDLIRENLPLNWLLATLYFRARVDGIENIPEKGPALIVGNHSGGNYIPDSFILGMAFATYFGSERPWYALTHSAAMAMPVVGRMLKSFGSIPASRENADEALRRGACVLVYPGGDIETYRPWWDRNKVKFAGRMGFVRTALKNRVPIVPVANVGSHETGIFLSDGQWLCKALGIDKSLRIKAEPIQVGLPWGIWWTDFLPRVLLPAKIEIRVLEPLDLPRTGPEAAADDEYVREIYELVTGNLQEAITDMASHRRWPIIG
ncbi:MAG TPA: lysophospholipid acyltransferase family protein [Candidatus Dormibacteraeota bacterium]|nr:lysophospholipid acyltransferase family protein [Candidatus Dormibacteraeota bacterium]